MNLLAIDSADGQASVALLRGEDMILRVNHNTRDSLSWMQQQVEELRSEFGAWSQLDALACGVGPGGFTGVRVAVGYVQGLALSTALPCIAVNSLDALAWRLHASGQRGAAWVALDARMNELYAARYQLLDRPQRKGDLQLLAADALIDQLSDKPICAGPGFEAWPQHYAKATSAGLVLDAAAVALAASHAGLKQACTADELQPVYVRNQVAKTLAQRRAERA